MRRSALLRLHDKLDRVPFSSACGTLYSTYTMSCITHMNNSNITPPASRTS